MTELKVCVFCGSRAGNDPAYTDAAHAVAHELAKRNLQLVFGGGGKRLRGGRRDGEENLRIVRNEARRNVLQIRLVGLRVLAVEGNVSPSLKPLSASPSTKPLLAASRDACSTSCTIPTLTVFWQRLLPFYRRRSRLKHRRQ